MAMWDTANLDAFYAGRAFDAWRWMGARLSGDGADFRVLAPAAAGASVLLDGREVRDAREAAALARGEHLDLAVAHRLLLRFLREEACDHISCASSAHEVQWHAGELQRGTALQEEYAIRLGDAHNAAERGLGIVDDLLECR